MQIDGLREEETIVYKLGKDRNASKYKTDIYRRKTIVAVKSQSEGKRCNKHPKQFPWGESRERPVFRCRSDNSECATGTKIGYMNRRKGVYRIGYMLLCVLCLCE